ncbi:MAG TPA: hypothetical protein VFJ74_03640 [Gemmatimonadaceae bacterium]|nr:hypothetical protein [Gemmatimonadaceae bacterium]
MRPGARLFTAVRFAAAVAAAVGATALAPPPPLAAQSRPALEIAIPDGPALSTDGPLVRAARVMDDAQMRDLLRNGFPARLHFRVELWTVGGWFNDLDRTTEWDVIVRYDPLDRSYRVARIVGDRVVPLGQFQQYSDAEATVALPFRAPITARRGKRSYYNVALDVETLSLTELDEVERWLRGELKPAVRGQRNPVTPVTRGLRTLFVRLIGGERRHYEVRSATFRG